MDRERLDFTKMACEKTAELLDVLVEDKDTPKHAKTACLSALEKLSKVRHWIEGELGRQRRAALKHVASPAGPDISKPLFAERGGINDGGASQQLRPD